MSSEWLSACESSCSDYPVGIDDLCGTGVIVGFIGGAFIAMVFLILYYFWAYDFAICDAAPVNPVDDWGNLNMCDLQILTGLGILLAGFVSLPVLKGAHWQMVCYLAWFATVTHMSGLSMMSKYLHGRSWERKSRMILMGVLLIILVVAMVPMAAITISEDDGGEDLVLTWNCNATCFFSPQFMANNLHSVSLGLQWGSTKILTQTAAQFGSAIMAIALMAFSFVVRLGKITPKLLSTTQSKKRSMSERVQSTLWKMANKEFSRAWQAVMWRELLVRPFLCVFILLRAWLLLWSSMFFEILWVCFLALYGLSRILQVSTQFYTVEGALNPDPDNSVHGYQTPRGDYRGGSWSFGQILPVFLLLAPVVGFLRSISPSDSTLQSNSHSKVSPVEIGRDIPHSPAIFEPHARTHSFGSIDEDTDAFPQGSLKCLRYLDKSEFGASQLAKHTFVFTSLLVISLMVWFLGELFLDIGVSYSLSTIISTLPGAFLVGVPLASLLHMFLVTSIFDVLPESFRRRSVYYWGAQVFVYGLLVTSVSVASKQSRGLCKAFWPPEKCDYAADTDNLVIFMAPNLYIILLMTCITTLAVLVTTGTHLYTSQSRDTRQESDEESSPLEVSPET
ncbi:hypothetical protein INS49_013358 [Diaporthe citri]|uniref:uncharacterized protein n=1 Tax=Diaporthe citri TaxID=83186 RepID=UPI001C80FE79|nr:uncharacterized protein INS49_013358 [Diaporthe citri]KAG6357481.1 hypothetical protein INS49_013358 [Diaporthe citri]